MERYLPSIEPPDITKTLTLRHGSERLAGNPETAVLETCRTSNINFKGRLLATPGLKLALMRV